MKTKYFVAGGLTGILCTTVFFGVVQSALSSLEIYSSSPSASSIVKHYDPFDQYAPLVEEDPIFIYLTVYKINNPTNISASLTKENVFDEMRYVDDIWGQANIILTSGYSEIDLDPESASEIENGNIHVLESTLASLAYPVPNQIPIFIVKKLPNHAGYTVIENNKSKYIVVDENAFDTKGRTLAHELGHYLGLEHPHNVTDQNEISGLMGNMGFADISLADISKAREAAINISDSQHKQ